MSALADELQRLFEFLERRTGPLPTRRLRIVEIRRGQPADGRGRARVHRNDLREVHEYETRFDELMAAGLPWVNLSCYGVLDEALIVAVETPAPPPKPAKRTSVNISGPSAAVLRHGWDAEEMLAVE